VKRKSSLFPGKHNILHLETTGFRIQNKNIFIDIYVVKDSIEHYFLHFENNTDVFERECYMVGLIIFLLVYGLMNHYIYKRISLGFDFSSVRKTTLKLILTLAGGLYFMAYFVGFVFSINLYYLHYAGILWLYGIIFLFGLSFLETGLSMAFPQKKRWWVIGALVLFALVIFHLSNLTTYGEKIPGYHEISRKMIQAGGFFLVYFIIYKIIAETLKLPNKKRGGLIAVFSIGAILKIMWFETGGILAEIGGIPILIGLIAAVFARVSTGLELSKKMKVFMLILFCAGFCIYLPRFFPWGHEMDLHSLYYIAGLWFGFLAFAIPLFLLESGVSVFYPSHSRVRVIIVLTILALTYGYAVYNGSRVPVVKELTIPINTLPKNMSGFAIVQLTDLHLGDIVSPGWLRKTVEKTNRLKPDLIVITGDLCDTANFEKYIDSLGKLKAKYGIIAVTGNHDEYSIDIFLEIAARTGMRVLRNRWVTVARGIQVVGIDDPTFHGGDSMPDLEAAMKNIDPGKPVILLSHQPDVFDEARQMGVDLQLSGHTHAGQVPPMNIVISLTYRYSYGLYRRGDSYIYTSSGTGLYEIPMRLMSNNEIVLITLVKN
jgi:predicted MPP superfamily phosphohydrolase